MLPLWNLFLTKTDYMKINFLPIIIAFLVFQACSDEPKTKETKSPIAPPINEKPIVNGKQFSADSAYAFIFKQISFGPRVCNSSAHTACGDYLVQHFKKYTERVTEQKANVKNWDGKILQIRNIIASVNPTPKKRVVIASHWDSRPYADQDPLPENHNKPVPAADDGASGVAVMMELARIFYAEKPEVGIDFVCFDAEDLGKSEHGSESYCLGSQYWSNSIKASAYKADYGILLDMVGGIGARFVFEGYSHQYAEPILRKVWDQATKMGHGRFFYYFNGGYITDDHFFVNTKAGIPMIDLIHYTESTPSRFPAY